MLQYLAPLRRGWKVFRNSLPNLKTRLAVLVLPWILLTAIGIERSLQGHGDTLAKIFIGSALLAIFLVYLYFEEHKWD